METYLPEAVAVFSLISLTFISGNIPIQMQNPNTDDFFCQSSMKNLHKAVCYYNKKKPYDAPKMVTPDLKKLKKSNAIFFTPQCPQNGVYNGVSINIFKNHHKNIVCTIHGISKYKFESN